MDDDLVKVLRVGEGKVAEETTAIPRSLRGHPPMLSSDFSVQILSGVRFASLLDSPSIPTVLPSRIWGPEMHARYPDSFRHACKEILLCCHSEPLHPPRPVPPAVNAAAILPRALWMEILTYTTRDWFEKPRNSEDLLRRRLKEEQSALREAQEARQRAEARVAMMERERDLYKLLLLRCQTRLRAAVGDRALPEEALVVGGEEELPHLVTDRQGGFLRALRILRRSVAAESDHDEEDDEEHEDVDLDESDDEESAVAMEDATEVNDDRPMDEDLVAISEPAVVGRLQARTVSISGEDF